MTTRVELDTSQQAGGGEIVLPSGLGARLFEVISIQSVDAPVYRFRFVSQGFDPSGRNLDTIQSDLGYLCERIALPRLAASGLSAERLVISLSDRETEFGVPTPGARQVFEAFTVDGTACIWEMF